MSGNENSIQKSPIDSDISDGEMAKNGSKISNRNALDSSDEEINTEKKKDAVDSDTSEPTKVKKIIDSDTSDEGVDDPNPIRRDSG